MNLLSASASTIWIWLSFAAAITLLEFVDVPLSKTDVLGVSGALVSMAVIVLGLPVATVMSTACLAFVLIVSKAIDRQRNAKMEIAAHFGGVLGASVFYLITYRMPVAEETRALVSSILIACGFAVAELLSIQLIAGREWPRFANLVGGNLRLQGGLIGAYVSVCTLGVIVFPVMGGWSLPLIVALLLLIRQSYVLLLTMRQTYRTTIQVLVRAAETTDERWAGHSERTSSAAREIAIACGMSSADVDAVGVAGLLHDIDLIGRTCPSDGSCSPSGVIRGVRSLERALAILEVLDGIESTARVSPERDAFGAYIVALASEIDLQKNASLREVHPRSLDRLADALPSRDKARAASAAIALGYGIPSIS